MKSSKVQLSDSEIKLFGNADIILTKNHILGQTKALLEEVQQQMQQTAMARWPGAELFTVSPKISRGENYLQMPYLVLDYPRVFGHADVFAIRSFFWWGHFFSSTLHLSGFFAKRFGPKLLAAMPQLAGENYFIQTGPDPWAHFFEGNYVAIKDLDEQGSKALFGAQGPIKIAAKWPLTDWPFAANHLVKSWERLLCICIG
jgi:hypothetical protein